MNEIKAYQSIDMNGCDINGYDATADKKGLMSAADKKIVDAAVNENHIMNSNFFINQRNVRDPSRNYGADRWYGTYHQHGDKSITLSTATTPRHNEALVHYFDNETINLLKHKDVTLSVYLVGEELVPYVCTEKVEYLERPVIDTIGMTIKGWRFDFYNDSGNRPLALRVYRQDEDAVDIRIRYIKLELGKAMTPYIPPDPALEMLKCQKYFYANAIGGIAMDDRNIFCVYPFPVIMRVDPTVTVKTLLIGSGGTVSTDNVTSITKRDMGMVTVHLHGGSLTSGMSYTIGFEADAELYHAV